MNENQGKVMENESFSLYLAIISIVLHKFPYISSSSPYFPLLFPLFSLFLIIGSYFSCFTNNFRAGKALRYNSSIQGAFFKAVFRNL